MRITDSAPTASINSRRYFRDTVLALPLADIGEIGTQLSVRLIIDRYLDKGESYAADFNVRIAHRASVRRPHKWLPADCLELGLLPAEAAQSEARLWYPKPRPDMFYATPEGLLLGHGRFVLLREEQGYFPRLPDGLEADFAQH